MAVLCRHLTIFSEPVTRLMRKRRCIKCHGHIALGAERYVIEMGSGQYIDREILCADCWGPWIGAVRRHLLDTVPGPIVKTDRITFPVKLPPRKKKLCKS